MSDTKALGESEGTRTVNGEFEYLGKGIYSIPEAARLTRLTSGQIRRWVRPRSSTAATSDRRPPIVAPDFEVIDSRLSLSFLDLIEVLFVKSFRSYGVSWKAIRTASQSASRLLDSNHPFAQRRFFTDGIDILTRIGEEQTERELMNLVRSQYEFDEIVAPLLYENLDFGELDLARRWWPGGRSRDIIVDPHLNLGKPVVARYNIPTSVLYQLYLSQSSSSKVADWYEIDEEAVVAAVDFEAGLAA